MANPIQQGLKRDLAELKVPLRFAAAMANPIQQGLKLSLAATWPDLSRRRNG